MNDSPESGSPGSPAIAPDEKLYRRVPYDTANTTERDTGVRRPSSAAFELDRDDDGQPEDGVSVFLGSLLEENGLRPEDIIEGHPGYAVAEVSVEDVTGAGPVDVQLDPNPDGPDSSAIYIAHALITGLDQLGRSKNHKVRQKIAKASRFITAPNKVTEH